MTNTIGTQERTPGAHRCSDDSVPRGQPAAQLLSADVLFCRHPIPLQILASLGWTVDQVWVCDVEAALPVKQPTSRTSSGCCAKPL